MWRKQSTKKLSRVKTEWHKVVQCARGNTCNTPSQVLPKVTMSIRVNMRRDATTIRFDLLCHLREVELKKHHIQSSNIINITLKRQVSHSDNLPLGPTAILQLLGHSRSHVMGKGAKNNLNSISQAYLPAIVD